MLIKFSCAHCRGPLEVNTTAVGAQTACPHCGKAITIPKQGIGPGATLGGFKVERKLAAGGMGEIYIARQLSMDRIVALKILPQHLGMQKEMSDRFLHELKLLARLEHPNIVTAFDAGEDAGILYFARALIQGESLEARIKREGFLTEQPALALTRKLASALAYAW
ncbi:MAG: protein kinase, partial [Lentisphaerae bacterium]|nr:protein kinase [Lentisphaerota bacterium]